MMLAAHRRDAALPRPDDDRHHLQAILELAGCADQSHAIATSLLDECGSLGSALSLSDVRMARLGVPIHVTRNLSVLKAAHTAALRRVADERPMINGCAAALDYLHATMAHLTHEVVRVLFLDSKCRLIRDQVMGSGTVTHCALHVREIVSRAFELAASKLVLVHNHPSGALEPSPQDIAVTKQLVEAATLFEIVVHDHLIIGRGGYFSLREAGMV